MPYWPTFIQSMDCIPLSCQSLSTPYLVPQDTFQLVSRHKNGCIQVNLIVLSPSCSLFPPSISFPPSPSLSNLGTFAVVELMIGNAIDKILDSIGRNDCQNSDADDNATSLEPLALNITGVEDCDYLKMEIAVTLAFLAGIIMVQLHCYMLG